MAVRSTRLFGPALLPAGSTVVMEPVGGNVVQRLVKSMRILNVTDAPRTFDMCIGAHVVGNAIYWRAVVPARSLISDGEWWVLAPDEQLVVYSDDADALCVMGSGAALT